MRPFAITRALNHAAINVQLPLVMVLIPVTTALLGITLMAFADDFIRDGQAAGSERAVVAAVGLIIVFLLLGVVASTVSAAMLLRGSIRAAVEQLHGATEAIAHGDFQHRITSARRDELGRLARSIDTMAERLERLDQARRRTLACVSHELRTPLTIIRGHAYTLARTEQVSARRDRLELVQGETVRLADLIEDLVEASTLYSGSARLATEPRDLVDLVRATVTRFDDRARERDIQLELTTARPTVPANVDPGRLDQMLANLLVNAIRHTEAGSIVRISVSLDSPDEHPVIAVVNLGCIEPGLAETIFEPFVQGEHRAGRIGLGLTITHALAAAHGGMLQLARTGMSDGEVEFRIVLPALLPARIAVSTNQVEDVGERCSLVQPVTRLAGT